MNLAFTTVLIFLILSPGFLARQGYFSSKLSVRSLNRNIVNELTLSIIPAILLQIISIFIVETFTSYYIDFNLLARLLIGSLDSNKFSEYFENINLFKLQIVSYNFCVLLSSFFIGRLCLNLIRYFKLDRKFEFFRFSNSWHYIFSGECLDFPNVPDDYVDINEKIINVLCKVNGETVIYTGTYFDYYIDQFGNLDGIHLKYPIRRNLSDDGGKKSFIEKYYVIPSRYLVIPKTDVININFRYFNIEEISEDSISEDLLKDVIELEE